MPVKREQPPLPRVKLVSLPGAKDASELYLQDPTGFVARFEQALQAAIPYEEHARIAAEIRARAAWGKAGSLAKEPRILEAFERDLEGAGVVGERRLCKSIYLAVTGRFLDRFASFAVKGPTASGKSWVVECVLSFFPPEAYYVLTAMSERALAYGTEPLSHRFLVLFEAAGLESDFASYLVRSLLSEGCVRYETVEKDRNGELKARLVEREGPTGVIVSTTAVALHPENETKLLSLTATDTPDQTKRVLSRLANEDLDEPDFARWHDLQVWLSSAEHRVSIPYAPALAGLVPPVAVRLRRDFRSVLSLIRSHALRGSRRDRLRHRPRDHRRRLRAPRNASRWHLGFRSCPPPQAGQEFRLPPCQGRRLRGYLRNEEERPNKPARYVLGDPLPEEIQLLPTRQALEGCADAARSPSNPEAPLPGDPTFRYYIRQRDVVSSPPCSCPRGDAAARVARARAVLRQARPIRGETQINPLAPFQKKY
jgi:hypothetical protein